MPCDLSLLNDNNEYVFTNIINDMISILTSINTTESTNWKNIKNLVKNDNQSDSQSVRIAKFNQLYLDNDIYRLTQSDSNPRDLEDVIGYIQQSIISLNTVVMILQKILI